MGIFIGILVSIGVVSASIDGVLGYSDVGLLVLYSLLGLLFPRIVGTSLSTIQIGTVIGAILALFNGNITSLISAALIFGVCFGGQHLIAAVRPNASASVGASSPMKINFPKISTSSKKMRNNYNPGYWHHLSDFLAGGEIPLGQISIGYQYADKDNPGGSKAHSDHRWATARYTDDSIQFSSIQGFDAYKLIKYQFEQDEPILFTEINNIEIVGTNGIFIEVRFQSDLRKFDVVVDVNKNYREDVECLIDVWKASQSSHKYRDLSLITNDPRMNALYKLTSDNFSIAEVNEARELAHNWMQMSEPFYEMDNDSTSRHKYAILDFMKSNFSKLTSLYDPKYIYRYKYPSVTFHNSLWHSKLGGELNSNFQGLSEVESAFQYSKYAKPEGFDLLVEKTRTLLNTPHARKLLSDLRYSVPQ